MWSPLNGPNKNGPGENNLKHYRYWEYGPLIPGHWDISYLGLFITVFSSFY